MPAEETKPVPAPTPTVSCTSDLTVACNCCDGTGGGFGWVCGKCRGKGRVPTEFGRRLIDFLDEYFQRS